MLKKSLCSVIVLTAVVACGGPSQTPEQRAQAAANKAKNEAIWATRMATDVNGIAYEVAVSPDKAYALVAPQQGKVWVMSDMVTAVNRVSGCQGKPDFLLASIAGGNLDTPIDMSTVKTNIDKMRSNLTC